jgi:uncharacterized protein YjbI with pentapeptide repeats
MIKISWNGLDDEIKIMIEVFFWAVLFVMGLSFGFYIIKGMDFYEKILVEAHGMVMDIFVFGVLIFYINRKSGKRMEVKRYKDEIDDFRNWKTPESAYRITGNIRRLTRNGVTRINLSDCFLREMDLRDLNLQQADLTNADLRGASLVGADLRGAKGLTVEMLCEVKTLHKARLDQEIESQVREKYHSLLNHNT